MRNSGSVSAIKWNTNSAFFPHFSNFLLKKTSIFSETFRIFCIFWVFFALTEFFFCILVYVIISPRWWLFGISNLNLLTRIEKITIISVNHSKILLFYNLCTGYYRIVKFHYNYSKIIIRRYFEKNKK